MCSSQMSAMSHRCLKLWLWTIAGVDIWPIVDVVILTNWRQGYDAINSQSGSIAPKYDLISGTYAMGTYVTFIGFQNIGLTPVTCYLYVWIAKFVSRFINQMKFVNTLNEYCLFVLYIIGQLLNNVVSYSWHWLLGIPLNAAFKVSPFRGYALLPKVVPLLKVLLQTIFGDDFLKRCHCNILKLFCILVSTQRAKQSFSFLPYYTLLL